MADLKHRDIMILSADQNTRDLLYQLNQQLALIIGELNKKQDK